MAAITSEPRSLTFEQFKELAARMNDNSRELNLESLYKKLADHTDSPLNVVTEKAAVDLLRNLSQMNDLGQVNKDDWYPYVKPQGFFVSQMRQMIFHNRGQVDAALAIKFPVQQPWSQQWTGEDSLAFGLGILIGTSGGLKQTALGNTELVQSSFSGKDEAYATAWANLNAQTPDVLECGSSNCAGGHNCGHHVHWDLDPKHANSARLLRCSAWQHITTARLMLPKVVKELCRILECKPQELVAVPVSSQGFYVGACTNPLSMLHLGEVTMAQDNRESDPYYLTSQAIQLVSEGSESADDMSAAPQLAEWKPYGQYGLPFAMVRYDNVIEHPVPASTQEKTQLRAAIRKGSLSVVRLQGSSECWHCRTQGTDLKKCAACKKALYCSAECQKAGWKLHKHECKTMRA